MSTYAEPYDGIDLQLPLTAADDEPSRGDLLDALLDHLDDLRDVTAIEADAYGCGALGCSRTESRLWRIDVEGARPRTLCPTHAVDFTRKESDFDV